MKYYSPTKARVILWHTLFGVVSICRSIRIHNIKEAITIHCICELWPHQSRNHSLVLEVLKTIDLQDVTRLDTLHYKDQIMERQKSKIIRSADVY